MSTEEARKKRGELMSVVRKWDHVIDLASADSNTGFHHLLYIRITGDSLEKCKLLFSSFLQMLIQLCLELDLEICDFNKTLKYSGADGPQI
jgi:hypothetical protein